MSLLPTKECRGPILNPSTERRTETRKVMKQIHHFVIALLLVQVAQAGPDSFSARDPSAAPTTAPAWYRDQEWNINTWFAYGFPGTDDQRNSLTDTFSPNPGPGRYDRYLADEHAFGGGAGVKYFFRRYFGIGLEGFALAADGRGYTVENFGATSAFKARDEHVVGGALASLTLRYPIGQSRFAPYVWAGGGGVFGGHDETAVYNGGALKRIGHDTETRGLGQFGAGLEIRLTPHIGLMSDVSWNVVEGSDNNFGLIRTGLNFSF